MFVGVVSEYNSTNILTNVVPAMFQHPGTRSKHNGGASMKTIISGVYAITNTINGHQYIGSAANIQRRWNEHKSDLSRNCHPNRHLQNAWNKYGADSFKFSVVETCFVFVLIFREQHYIDTLHPAYNKSPSARNNLGMKHSEEAKEKMRLARLGIKRKPLSDEVKQKIRLSNVGKTRSDEFKKKLSSLLKGKKQTGGVRFHSEETKQKMSLAHMGNKHNVGRHLSEEHKQKIRESVKAAKAKKKQGA